MSHRYGSPGPWQAPLRSGSSRNHQKRKGSSTYKTKLKLDKEVGGGDLFELCTIANLIAYPMLEPQLSKSASTCSSQHPNLQFRKLLKLQLGVIGVSDIEWVKRKVPLLDSWILFEG